MALQRTVHWAEKELHQFLLNNSGTPFSWGFWDCCLFPANAIRSFTGVDLATDFRGKYTDRASAFALIHSVTGGTTVADAAEYCAKQHELLEYTNPRFAQRGDLVVAKAASEDGTEIAGIVHLTGQIVSVGEKGLIRLPITSAQRAWKV